MLPVPFQFIKDNWVLIRVLWDDIDHNSLYHYNISDYDDNGKSPSDGSLYEKIVNKEDLSKILWSCFFAADFILDLYGVYSRDVPELNSEPGFNRLPAVKASNFVSFEQDFHNGFVYKFGIINHQFIVIYLSEEELYYIDYYSETERAEYYRFDSMKREYFLDYIKNYLDGNVEEHSNFHQGSENYSIDCHYSFQQHTPSLVYAKTPITFNPTIDDVVRVLENSVTDENAIKDLEDNEFSYKEWRSMRDKCLAYLKM